MKIYDYICCDNVSPPHVKVVDEESGDTVALIYIGDEANATNLACQRAEVYIQQVLHGELP